MASVAGVVSSDETIGHGTSSAVDDNTHSSPTPVSSTMDAKKDIGSCADTSPGHAKEVVGVDDVYSGEKKEVADDLTETTSANAGTLEQRLCYFVYTTLRRDLHSLRLIACS